MDTEEIAQIRVGQTTVGIVGLKAAIDQLKPVLSGSTDKEIVEALLSQLGKKNYIPEKAKDQYGQALVREFKLALGEKIAEPAFEGLTIRVLGMGCTNCQTVFNRVMEVLNELNLTADLEHITDVKKIAAYGILGSPALLINGKVVSVGQVPNKKQIEAWLTNKNKA